MHMRAWYKAYGEDNVLVVDKEQDSQSKVNALLTLVSQDLFPFEEYPWEELKDDGSDEEDFYSNNAYSGHPGLIRKVEDHFAHYSLP